MYNTKKCFCFMLSMLICFGLTGCSNKVDQLMSEKNYKAAYNIMKDNPDKYSDIYDECRYNLAKQYYKSKKYAQSYKLLKNNDYKKSSKLLKEVKPLYMNQKYLNEVNKTYDNIINKVNSSWKGKIYLNIDGTEIDSKDFYYAMGSLIESIIQKIDNNEYDIEENKSEVKNIVGYLPEDVQTLRSDLSKLQKYFITDKSEYALGKTSNLFRDINKNYVQTYVDSNENGHFLFNNLYNMIDAEKISPLAFSCILALYKAYGAEITIDNYIDVSWNKSTKGYDFCAPNNQWGKILNWENNLQIDWEQYLDGTDGVAKAYIHNPNGLNFKFISIYTIIYDGNDNYISTDYSRKENLIGDTIEMEFRIKNVQFDTDYKWVTYTLGMLN